VEVLEGLAGVGRILDSEAQKDLGVYHPRSGDLLLEAAPGYWFAYDWWVEERCAPPYARTVDIHNKPGYDPLELFAAQGGGGTARDGKRLKGTHGRAGGAAAALILPEGTGPSGRKLAAAELCELLCELAGS
jgi:hypothetical protein